MHTHTHLWHLWDKWEFEQPDNIKESLLIINDIVPKFNKRGRIGVYICDLGFGNGFLDMTWKAQATKEKKIDKLDLINIKKLLCFEGHYQEYEKRIHRMEENTCKLYIW